MSLTFQRSFKLEFDNIAKILDAVVQMPFASRNDIADFTGIPIGKKEIHGKVEPTILYAAFCGLVLVEIAEGTTKRTLTEFGKIVYQNDKNLRRSVTRWGMHYHLSSQLSGAPAWSFFVHEFLPSHDRFSRSDFSLALTLRFPELSPRYVNENERNVLQSYTDNGALGKLKIVECFEKEKMERGRANYPNEYLAAYILAEIWEANHPEKTVVDPASLGVSGHLATTLNLNAGDLQNCLNEMSSIGAISQLREATPFQVVRKWQSKYELLRRAYEGL